MLYDRRRIGKTRLSEPQSRLTDSNQEPMLRLMNVVLSPELEELIDSKVDSGLYDSASDVVSDALRLLGEWDQIQEARQAELKRDIRRGLEQLDRGESAPLDMEAVKAKARLLRR